MTPDEAAANLAAWQRWGVHAAPQDTVPGVLPTRLELTQIPGLGPGDNLLGDVADRTVIELGCGAGDTTAYLAARGATVVGVDAAPAQIARARRRWGHIVGATFVLADAADYLSRPSAAVDIVLSVFGAADFAPPGRLLRGIADRLRPGGQLLISTVHPAQQTRLPLDRLRLGAETMPIVRPLPDPAWWAVVCATAGLTRVQQIPVTAPGEDTPRCLIVSAIRVTD